MKDEQTMLHPFDAAKRLLNRADARNLSLARRLNLFFVDVDMLPLLIHENYLSAYGSSQGWEQVGQMAESAEYISLGDCLGSTMRSENAWELLPNCGFCSVLSPAALSAGNLTMTRFPQ